MSPKSFTSALLCATCALALPAFAHPTAISDEFRQQFQRAVEGDASLTDALEEKSAALTRADPDDAVSRAYHGSALTLQGRDAWAPWKKMRKVEQGLDEIDKALVQVGSTDGAATGAQPAPELEARMTAIGTFLGLPDFFNRLDSARQLLSQTMKRADFASAPAASRAQVFAWAARAALRSGDTAGASQLADRARAEGWTKAIDR